MTAECEILVDHLKDVLTIPVAAVVEQRGAYFAWVKTPDRNERRPLVLGATNDQFVEVKDGLVDGELVVLNPRAVVPEARAIKEAEESEREQEVRRGTKAPADAKKMPGGRRDRRDGLARVARCRRTRWAGLVARWADLVGPEAAVVDHVSMSQLDKDGDGKLSKEELPRAGSSLLRRDGHEQRRVRRRVRKWPPCGAAWAAAADRVARWWRTGGGGPGGGWRAGWWRRLRRRRRCTAWWQPTLDKQICCPSVWHSPTC